MIAANQRVGDRVPLGITDEAVKNVTVRKPDGSAVTIARTAGVFDETDQPGVYTIDLPAGRLVVRRKSGSSGEQDCAAARRDDRAVRRSSGQPFPPEHRPRAAPADA